MSKKNKADCSRFMIAENKMAEYGVKYVYHTQQPRFLARKISNNSLSDFEIVDDIDDMIKYFNGDVTKVAGLMRRLGDWWVAHIKWEKDNYEQ